MLPPVIILKQAPKVKKTIKQYPALRQALLLINANIILESPNPGDVARLLLTAGCCGEADAKRRLKIREIKYIKNNNKKSISIILAVSSATVNMED